MPLIALAAFAPCTTMAREYLTVPRVDWNDVAPYVQAHIVPVVRGEEFSFYICQDVVDRTVVAPFDASLGDFTKALVLQTLRKDHIFRDALWELGDRFQKRARSLANGDRDQLRPQFREALTNSPEIYPRIQLMFEKAKTAGRLRCWGCEKSLEFAPAARRWAKGRE